MAMQIEVCMVSGIRLNMAMEPGCLVSQVKQHIAEQLLIPTQFQKLIVGEQILHDRQRLHHFLHRTYHNPISIVLVVSVEEVCAALERNDGRIYHLACLESLGQHCKGDERAIAAVSGCLEDEDDDVRVAAVNALCALAAPGDQDVITAVGGRLEDAVGKVRVAAVEALGELAASGIWLSWDQDEDDVIREDVITAVRGRLEDEDDGVREAAVSAICELAAPGDQDVITEVSGLLEDAACNVRAAAVKALGHLANREDVITAVRGRLEDEDDGVREAAVKALGNLAWRHLADQDVADQDVMTAQ